MSEQVFEQSHIKSGMEVDGEQPDMPKREIAEDGSLKEKDSPEDSTIKELEDKRDILKKAEKIVFLISEALQDNADDPEALKMNAIIWAAKLNTVSKTLAEVNEILGE